MLTARRAWRPPANNLKPASPHTIAGAVSFRMIRVCLPPSAPRFSLVLQCHGGSPPSCFSPSPRSSPRPRPSAEHPSSFSLQAPGSTHLRPPKSPLLIRRAPSGKSRQPVTMPAAAAARAHLSRRGPRPSINAAPAPRAYPLDIPTFMNTEPLVDVPWVSMQSTEL